MECNFYLLRRRINMSNTSLYNVGDKVIVREDLEIWKTYDGGCTFVKRMDKFRGKIVTIKSKSKNDKGYDRFEITSKDGKELYWSSSMFLPVKEDTDNLGVDKYEDKKTIEDLMADKEFLETILRSISGRRELVILEKVELDKKIREMMDERAKLNRYITDLANAHNRTNIYLKELENEVKDLENKEK